MTPFYIFSRFRAISFPEVSRTVTPSEALITNSVIWTAGLLISLPCVFFYEVATNQIMEPHKSTISACVEAWPSTDYEVAYYLIVKVLMCFLAPALIFAICNMYVWINMAPTSYNYNRSLIRRKRYLRVFTLLGLIYFISWLPLHILTTGIKFLHMNISNGGYGESLMTKLVPWFQFLSNLSTCVNPLVYDFFNKNFKKAIGQELRSSTSPARDLCPISQDGSRRPNSGSCQG